jgi:hypothetical protein
MSAQQPGKGQDPICICGHKASEHTMVTNALSGAHSDPYCEVCECPQFKLGKNQPPSQPEGQGEDLETMANTYCEYHYSEGEMRKFYSIAYAAYMACGRKLQRQLTAANERIKVLTQGWTQANVQIHELERELTRLRSELAGRVEKKGKEGNV